MIFTYVGLIKKNTDYSKALVQSVQGVFYVWTAPHELVDHFQRGELPPTELELANERQIEAGRGNLWVPNASQVNINVKFQGIVSGGKVSKRVLVNFENKWFTYVVPSDEVLSLKNGDSIRIDRRFLEPARDDHIRAGFGLGKLRRMKRSVGRGLLRTD